MNEEAYIFQPGIQIIMFLIITVVLLIIAFLFMRIQSKKQKLKSFVNNQNNSSQEIKEMYLNKILNYDFHKKPKSLFFLLEKSLPHFKNDLTKRDFDFFSKEFVKINKNNIIKEDLKIIELYIKKISE